MLIEVTRYENCKKYTEFVELRNMVIVQIAMAISTQNLPSIA